MQEILVTAPFSGGVIWGKETYRDGRTHTKVGSLQGGLPIDIGGGNENTAVYWHAFCRIPVKSVRVKQVGGICAVADLWSTPWSHGVVVEMYTEDSAQGTLIGKVGYGHLKDRQSDGIYNFPLWRGIRGLTSLYMGRLPADCKCGCSWGIHTHMQCTNGVITDLPAFSNIRVEPSSPWIYKFTY